MAIDPLRVKELFVHALELHDVRARQAYLDKECSGNAELGARIAALCAAYENPLHPIEAREVGPFSTGPYEPSPESAGAVIAGKYKLLQHIGEGGMGSVWLADQTEPVKRRVALKLVRSERGSSKTILARFEAERQAIALMDHPHIAKLLDAGTTETGAPFFAMELIKGVSLTQFCDDQKLSVQQRLALFQQVCAAVQHAHQKGVIHRDLKPSNILVESHDGVPVPKVIDFGLAKAISGQQLTEHSLFTALGQVAGTPLYMAPEQAACNTLDVDTRADIYALGVILYELLTGTTPVERAQLKRAALDEMLRVIRESEPPAPSKRLSSSTSAPSVAANRQMEPAKLGRFVRGELDWIVMKALAKERERRYETASGLARDLERFLNHEPVLAGPPSKFYKLRKFVRRNRVEVLATLSVILALLAGLAGTIWGLIGARQQERIARVEAEQKEEARRAESERAEGERQAKQQALDEKQRAEAGEKLAGERLLQLAAEKQRVEEEKRIAQAFSDFLQKKLLGQADTRVQANALLERGGFAAAANKDITIRELLDRAAAELTPEKIESSFPGQPLLQAEVLHTVGTTYCGVGEYHQAVELLQRAAALRQRGLAPDDAETLNTLENLAVAYGYVGKLHEAIPLLERIRDARVKKLGADNISTLTAVGNLGTTYLKAGKLPQAIALLEKVQLALGKKLGQDHLDTLEMQNNLASAYQAAGKLREAISLFEKVRDVRLKKLGPDHPDTLESFHNLAGALMAAGRVSQALALQLQVRDQVEKKLGPEHPHTLSAISGLATTYYAAGKLPQALQLFERLRDVEVKKLGPEHPATLGTLNNLAQVYQATGRLPEAIQLLEHVSEIETKKLGPEHPSTLTSLNNLATAYQEAGKLEQATSLYEKVREIRLRNLGPEHPDTLVSSGCLAYAYRAAGKLTQAIPILEQVFTDMEKKLGPDHPRTLISINNLAAAYWSAKQLDKSVPLFEEALKRQEKLLGRDHPTTLLFVLNLGVNYREAGRLKEALPLLEEAYRRGRTDPRLAELGNVLVAAYFEAGRPADAAKVIHDQLSAARKKVRPDSPELAGALATAGKQFLAQKQYADAETVLRESLSLREKLVADKKIAPWQLANVKSMLGGVLLGQNKVAEAGPLIQAGYEGLKKDEAAIPPPSRSNLFEALERLIALADVTGNKEEAARRRKEREAIRATLKESHP